MVALQQRRQKVGVHASVKVQLLELNGMNYRCQSLYLGHIRYVHGTVIYFVYHVTMSTFHIRVLESGTFYVTDCNHFYMSQ